MSDTVQQEGLFRGFILTWGLKEFDSGSICAKMKVQLTEAMIDGEWVDWSDAGLSVWGDIWVVGKDGNLNERNCNDLIRSVGWDGDFDTVVKGDLNGLNQFQLRVKCETGRDGVDRYEIAYLREYNYIPCCSKIEDDTVRKIQRKFKGKLAALASSKDAKAAPRRGARAKPKVRSKPVPPDVEEAPLEVEESDPVEAGVQAPHDMNEDDLPF